MRSDMIQILYSTELLAIITLIGALSPMLSFARLYQMKEWRMDRLKQHVSREGWLKSFIGRTRITIIVLYVFFWLGLLSYTLLTSNAPIRFTIHVVLALTIPLLLYAFAIFSAVQFLTNKQPTPVWTKKALLICVTSFVLTLVIIWLVSGGVAAIATPLVVILQPLLVLVAEAIWRPLDIFLKRRIFRQARIFRSQLHQPIVIGIAGSVGKTTTKELIKAVLADLHPLATPAHVNTEMGVAQWLLTQKQLANQKSPVIIVEMGAYRCGEIALLSSVVQPTIGVMTALGSDHLGLFGSEEEIIKANSELIESLPKDGHLFLDGANMQTCKLSNMQTCPTTVTQPPTDIRETSAGLEFSIQPTTYKIPLYGNHNIANALLAIAVAQHLGVKNDRIRELLQTFKPVAHTFNVREEQGVLLLDDTYNISPLSFHAALDWAQGQSKKPKTLFSSGLLELGGQEARFLEELGTKASGIIDRAIFTSQNDADAFKRGFGHDVEVLTADTERVPPGSTLICIGRMPLSSIQRLLPQ